MAGYIGSKAVNLSTTGADINGDANIDGDLSFRDNDKAIFGAGSDLQIYHDGSHSYISDQGAGNLRIAASDRIQFYNAATDEVSAQFIAGAESQLRYAGSTKLATTSTGVDITGTLTSDGLTVDGDGSFSGAFPRLSLIEDDTTDLNTTLTSAGGEFKVYTSNDDLSSFASRLEINHSTGDLSLYDSTGTTAKFFWDASAESLGIGKTDRTNVSVLTVKNVSDVSTNTAEFYNDNGNRTFRFAQDTSGNATQLLEKNDGTDAILLNTNGDSYFNGGNVGIGNTSSGYVFTSGETRLAVGDGSEHAAIQIYSGTAKWGGLEFADDATNGTGQGRIGYYHPNDYMQFDTSGSERMRLDASGNLLVGTTDTTLYNNGAGGNTGVLLSGSLGNIQATRSAAPSIDLNRLDADGDIAVFYKNGSVVGSIGNSGANIYLAGANSGFKFYSSGFHATNTSGVAVDNSENIGASNVRWNDAYITNGVTTGSDGNDKQDIRDLTEAEQRVAVACKGLLKAWRWKSAVEEKGDDARIHCGIIAQDLQAAFAAEGLDAGRYAMFMSNTWWETQIEVPAVEAVAEVLDEDGNVVTEAVEAADAYTRTDTYDTQEEAPDGATERTRLGVRYSELLAFIIGAL